MLSGPTAGGAGEALGKEAARLDTTVSACRRSGDLKTLAAVYAEWVDRDLGFLLGAALLNDFRWPVELKALVV